jgi:hypothetical protein
MNNQESKYNIILTKNIYFFFLLIVKMKSSYVFLLYFLTFYLKPQKMYNGIYVANIHFYRANFFLY